jgi:hypothetical protein
MKKELKIMVTFGPTSVFSIPVAAQPNEVAKAEAGSSNQMRNFAMNGALSNQIRSFTSDSRRQGVNSLQIQRLLACKVKLSTSYPIRGRRYNTGRSPSGNRQTS